MTGGRVRSKRFDDCCTSKSANPVQSFTSGTIRIVSRPIETRSDLVILFCEGRGVGARLKSKTLKWPVFTASYKTPLRTRESPEQAFFRFKNVPVQSASPIPCRFYMSRGPPADSISQTIGSSDRTSVKAMLAGFLARKEFKRDHHDQLIL